MATTYRLLNEFSSEIKKQTCFYDIIFCSQSKKN